MLSRWDRRRYPPQQPRARPTRPNSRRIGPVEVLACDLVEGAELVELYSCVELGNAAGTGVNRDGRAGARHWPLAQSWAIETDARMRARARINTRERNDRIGQPPCVSEKARRSPCVKKLTGPAQTCAAHLATAVPERQVQKLRARSQPTSTRSPRPTVEGMPLFRQPSLLRPRFTIRAAQLAPAITRKPGQIVHHCEPLCTTTPHTAQVWNFFRHLSRRFTPMPKPNARSPNL